MGVMNLVKKVDGKNMWVAGHFSKEELLSLLEQGYEKRGFINKSNYKEGKAK